MIEAMHFAVFAHDRQMYGNFPYIVHLCDVVRNLRAFHYDDEEMLMAGFLHDVVEDCDVSLSIIQNRFGIKVAKLVDAVTGEGSNRQERKLSTIKKLNKYPKAIPLKMVDRLCNITNCITFNPRMLSMYEKEFDDYDLLFESADRVLNAKIRKLLNK